MKRKSLGQILLEMGAIDPLRLKSALAYQRNWGTPLGKVLVDNRLCSREHVMQALETQSGLRRIDLDRAPIPQSAAKLLSAKVALLHRVVPLRLQGDRNEVLLVAIAAPASLEALDAVKSVTGKRVIAYLAADDAVARVIAKLYGGGMPAIAKAPSHDITPATESEFELDFGLGSNAERPVLIYGWAEENSHWIAATLAAEGIETREEYEAVRMCGVNVAQGYYFAKPGALIHKLPD